jgi:hypothetical protein
MPVFMNPFQKHDISDFPDTYVPLAQAERHPSVVAAHKSIEIDKDKDYGLPPSPTRAASDNEYSTHTIEGLIAEIDLGMPKYSHRNCTSIVTLRIDIAASGHDTAYDRR